MVPAVHEGRRGGFRVVEVAVHQVLAAQADLPVVAKRELHARRRQADAARLALDVAVRQSGPRAALGGPVVDARDRSRESPLEGRDELGRHRGRARVDLLQARRNVAISSKAGLLTTPLD